jgi:hypothetical protein
LSPPVEDRGVELVLVTQSGNQNPINQVLAQIGNLLLRGVMLALAADQPSPL